MAVMAVSVVYMASDTYSGLHLIWPQLGKFPHFTIFLISISPITVHGGGFSGLYGVRYLRWGFQLEGDEGGRAPKFLWKLSR